MRRFARWSRRGIFNWRVRGIAEPFYVLCGYGQSGARLARALDRLGNRLVIIDPSAERIAPVAVQDYATPPLTLAADARLADVLEDGGVRSPYCLGLIALAGEDAVNQAIAIGARVLNPDDPDRRARQVRRRPGQPRSVRRRRRSSIRSRRSRPMSASALRAPEILQLEEWLTATPGAPVPARHPAAARAWVLVGFGRFGRAIARVLDREGIEWKAFDPRAVAEPDAAAGARRLHREHPARRRASRAPTCWSPAPTVDAVNLGATTLARRVKPDIFVVIRQNHMQDRALVEAARADLTFVQSRDHGRTSACRC